MILIVVAISAGGTDLLGPAALGAAAAVDDGAIATIAWIAVACLTLRQVTTGIWSGPILFAGLSAIFLPTTRARP